MNEHVRWYQLNALRYPVPSNEYRSVVQAATGGAIWPGNTVFVGGNKNAHLPGPANSMQLGRMRGLVDYLKVHGHATAAELLQYSRAKGHDWNNGTLSLAVGRGFLGLASNPGPTPSFGTAPHPVAARKMHQFLPTQTLAAIIGKGPFTRPEVTERVWAYVTRHHLRDTVQRKIVHADGLLGRLVAGERHITLYELVVAVNRQLCEAGMARKPTSRRAELDRRAAVLRAKTKVERPAGNAKPLRVSSTARTEYQRDPNVQAWVLQEAHGACELCHKRGPFVGLDGEPFLEVHHLRHLARGGTDKVENTVAVCPNCHRRVHVGVDAGEAVENLYRTVKRLVRE